MIWYTAANDVYLPYHCKPLVKISLCTLDKYPTLPAIRYTMTAPFSVDFGKTKSQFNKQK